MQILMHLERYSNSSTYNAVNYLNMELCDSSLEFKKNKFKKTKKVLLYGIKN